MGAIEDPAAGALEELATQTQRVIEGTPGLGVPVPVPAPAEVAVREPRDYVVLVDGEVNGEAVWVELGSVEAYNRAGAVEAAEAEWPQELEGAVKVHLIPARFWQEISPEAAPPPPPKRKWKGV